MKLETSFILDLFILYFCADKLFQLKIKCLTFYI